MVELSIAMGVFLIFMTFATPFMFGQLRQAVRTENQVDLQQNGRQAMRVMVRELRQASTLVTAAGRPTSDTELSFDVDLDGDGTIESEERLTYAAEAGELLRGPNIDDAVPLADGVEGVTFTMFGSNLAFDTDPADGIVTEDELNPDGTWSQGELFNVTRVDIALAMAENEDEQSYAARVFMRNRVAG